MKFSQVSVLIFIVLTAHIFAERSDVVGKVIVGYQGWFDAEGSGSPTDTWIHWGVKNGVEPASPDQHSFEIYPDMREYTKTYPTGFANLGNGEPATLFSSWDQSTIDVHVRWMKEYGIDGAALQRFVVNTVPGPHKQLRDQGHSRFKNSAEKHGVKFYVMYDMSGKFEDFAERIKTDWENTILDTLNLTASPQYAYENEKPVVCIWGMGFASRLGEPEECLDLINWFKDKGCYVIGGVPTRWRTGVNDSKPGFEDVYKAYDMIQPWMAGRMNMDGVDNIKKTVLEPDFAYCKENNIDYSPCMFPGFGWGNWKIIDGEPTPTNGIPRLHGDFMWKQAYNMRSLGIPSAYVGMFDEYDEGTNIMKSAEDISMIPTDHPTFVTMDVDGVRCSSDFYLRLTGDITRMIKEEIPMTEEHPTVHYLSTETSINANIYKSDIDISVENGILTYPSIFEGKNVDVSLFTINGRKINTALNVKKGVDNVTALHFNNLSKGVYLVVLENDNKVLYNQLLSSF